LENGYRKMKFLVTEKVKEISSGVRGVGPLGVWGTWLSCSGLGGAIGFSGGLSLVRDIEGGIQVVLNLAEHVFPPAMARHLIFNQLAVLVGVQVRRDALLEGGIVRNSGKGVPANPQ
jgi:hypothetical protein